jgi:hypothetical protein
MTLALPRPGPEEYADAFAGYVSRAPELTDAVPQLDSQGAALAALFRPVTEEQANLRYAPGKWSVKEVLGHLSDTERILSYRMLRIGRGDGTPLAGFDENAYVPAARFDRRPLEDLVYEWAAVRSATVALVRGMPPDAWPRRGVSNGKAISARALLYIIAGHVEHHRIVLDERYRLR